MALPGYVLVGLVDAALGAGLALVVYAVAPRETTNRVLAAALLVEGIVELAAALSGDLGPTTEIQLAWLGVFGAAFPFLPAGYLLLLRRLDTPLAAPLRSRGAPLVILGAAAVCAIAFLVPQAPPFDLLYGYFMLHGVVSLYGLGAALHAWRRAPVGTPTRRRNGLFVLAFGARDALFLVYVVDAFVVDPTQLFSLFGVATPYYTTLVFVPLLAYAILQAQVLGIDLQLKSTIRRGVLAGPFVAVFFIVSEAAQQILQATIGPWIGLLAAALLVLALAPLQRMAHRVANAALPGVEASDEYLAYRRLALYRAAVESAHEAGGISEKERLTLARLREKLDIAPDSAALLEREATGG